MEEHKENEPLPSENENNTNNLRGDVTDQPQITQKPKPKRKLSEKQLANLAKGREKRRMNMQSKKQKTNTKPKAEQNTAREMNVPTTNANEINDVLPETPSPRNTPEKKPSQKQQKQEKIEEFDDSISDFSDFTNYIVNSLYKKISNNNQNLVLSSRPPPEITPDQKIIETKPKKKQTGRRLNRQKKIQGKGRSQVVRKENMKRQQQQLPPVQSTRTIMYV